MGCMWHGLHVAWGACGMGGMWHGRAACLVFECGTERMVPDPSLHGRYSTDMWPLHERYLIMLPDPS